VIFDPEIYPIKWTLLTGRGPKHEVREVREEAPDEKSSDVSGPAPTPHSPPEGDA
jgi:hypothetical protein